MRAKKDTFEFEIEKTKNKICDIYLASILFSLNEMNSFAFSIVKKKKKKHGDFFTLFFTSPERGKSPRYEILLVHYLKSDSAATTFDFFRLFAS